MGSPESLVRFLVFQLQTLGDRNAHHEFEHLCRRVATARIASNLLPATGPVSGGGDGGRDFETHPSDLGAAVGVEAATNSWAARTTSSRLAFCCTIQRTGLRAKLVADAATIMRAEPRPDRIHSFVAAALPVAERQRAIAEVRAQHDIELVVHDALYLAEQLAQPDLFWVAERYLDAPPEMAPEASVGPAGTPVPEWYQDTRRVWERRDPLPLEVDVLELTDSLRLAASFSAARADLPLWLGHMHRLAQQDLDLEVQQRARYEIAYATFYVEGTLLPVDEIVRDFFESVLDHSEPELLRNAALLLQNVALCINVRNTTVTSVQAGHWADALREHVDSLLEANEQRSNKRAMLLHVRAHLHMHLQMDLPPLESPQAVRIPPDMGSALLTTPTDPRLADVVYDPDIAVTSWLTLARELEEGTQFPVNHLSGLLAQLTPTLVDREGWRELNTLLDRAVADNVGDMVAGERCFLRGKHLFDLERNPEALAEFLAAREHYGKGGEPRGAMVAGIFSAYAYQRLGFHLAAEHVSLKAAVTGTRSTDLTTRGLIGSAMAIAAASEYRRGVWVGAVELILWSITSELFYGTGMRDEPGSHMKDMADSLLVIVAASQALLGEQYGRALVEPLRDANVSELLGVDLDKLAADGRQLSAGDWDAKLVEADAPPAQDLSDRYEVTFSALGSEWRIRAADSRDRVCVRACDRLAAAAQILLADIADDRLGLLASHYDVLISVDAANAGRTAREEVSSRRWSWAVVLTPVPDVDSASDGYAGGGALLSETLSVLSWILAESSIVPTRQAVASIQSVINTRVITRFISDFPYERLRGPFEDPELRASLRDAFRPATQVVRPQAAPLEAGPP